MCIRQPRWVYSSPNSDSPGSESGATVNGQRKALAWGFALAVLLALSVTITVTIGPAGLGVLDVRPSNVDHLGMGSSDLTRIEDGIVWQLRLPRVLTAAAVKTRGSRSCHTMPSSMRVRSLEPIPR